MECYPVYRQLRVTVKILPTKPLQFVSVSLDYNTKIVNSTER
jgi:hypothetical protein